MSPLLVSLIRRAAPALLASALAACSSPETSENDVAPGASSLPSPSASAAAPAPGVKEPEPPPAPKVFAPLPPLPEEELYPDTIEEQREALFRRMVSMLHVTDEQMAAVRAIFERSPVLGQGNPKVTKHPMTRKECREARNTAGGFEQDEPACSAPFMTPIYDALAGEKEADARVCIDRYEFPGIPCEHPVTGPTAKEAAELCSAIGKRLCDAHEWEGACAGAVHAPEQEYSFGKARKESKDLHNRDREIVWAYGRGKDHSKCATKSRKTKGCTSSGWKRCGTNTFPAGSFPECKSPFGVYDQHGNVAEHMNLPLRPEEMTSRGGTGQTEMKGSWFIFSDFEAHPDDCRWRAPDWHGTRVTDPNSHGNYHLGFRCCKSVGK
ncbi:SUMF1/EgtB/PvdO family nonheme iron enzyme [Polyangium mundeleinium]|uniref:SUMF1/EgtB/PvdO family nonheme iron enzyme n=1 Tax=Polyangium mundeleinium TaxID=2995306 RepID=A0ABT5EWK2_9BACT|nr:SUMF1/EgtB/PvdO family nonheme iron enzyme [Polyangium mundeleinium]MDC0746180.1 SUMF1/EgtB/PvdO family nonheme iron enzyme [Polyangium mundeleinium]